MNTGESKIVALCAAFLAVAWTARGAFELGAPFRDGCVLQRDRAVNVWGFAAPGAEVKASFAGAERAAKADAKGRWEVVFDAMPACREGRTLSVVGPEGTCEAKDVLVGDVWLASGQSNMECHLWSGEPHRRDQDGALVAQMTVRRHVRVMKAPKRIAPEPCANADARWQRMTPEEMPIMRGGLPSAIGCYFGVMLSDELGGVPVGVVDLTLGGTDIDSWTPPCGYRGKAGLDREKNWKWVPEKEWDDSKQPHGPCGGACQQPRALWNGVVAPFAGMAVKGMLWYQGCQNVHEPQRYAAKMHALYDGWREEFRFPDMPMFFVQLAPMGSDKTPALQEAQERFAREEPRVGMVTVADRGNPDDCHPCDKQVVARRLLAQALSRVYGYTWLDANPPTLKDWKLVGGKFVLSFDHVKRWYQYHADWSVESGFEIAGADGKWVPAVIDNLAVKERRPYKSQGWINGRDLVVSAPGVPEPKKLRYLHSPRAYGSIKNELTLPLGPFHVECK